MPLGSTLGLIEEAMNVGSRISEFQFSNLGVLRCGGTRLSKKKKSTPKTQGRMANTINFYLLALEE